MGGNPDYWKKGKPYLDGIDFNIVKNNSTGMLAFVAGDVDMTSPYFFQVLVLKDIKEQMGPEAATCELVPSNGAAQRADQSRVPAVQQAEVALLRTARPSTPARLHRHPPRRARAISAAPRRRCPRTSWVTPAEFMQQLPWFIIDVAEDRRRRRRASSRRRRATGWSPPELKPVDAQISADRRLPGGDPARSLQAGLSRTLSSTCSTTYLVLDLKICCKLYDASPARTPTATRSTTSIRPSTVTTPAALEATMMTLGSAHIDKTFIKEFMEGLTRTSAGRWFGTSSAGWPRMSRARSSSRPLGDLLASALKNYVPMVNGIYNGLRMEDVWLDK